VSAISGVSQTKYMSDILSKWKAEPDFDPEETAVVLADEALLIPVMHGVPDIIGPYNVSMGYPLKSSSSAALISNLMKLQLNARVINNNAHFYFKQVIYLLNHPLIKRWVDTDIQEFSEQIVQQNRVRISVSDFEKVGLNPLFYQANNSLNEFIEYLNTIISSLLKIEVSDDEGLAREHEFLYKLWRGMLRINDLVLEHQIQFTDIRTYSQLLEQIIRSTNIPFDGEPLEGMQVVGFLETRPIDFKRVIMLSLNEGVFPKKSIAPSFIPQNLRLGFGLPSQEYRDAIFAYYFYRLLQRSKEVYILYNTATNDIGGGEPSRFITQLKYEWPYKIQFKNMMRSAYLRPVQQLTVKKDKRIYNQLVEICSGNAARKLSATALNQYIKCPMMFYFSTVLEHRDAEEISEEIDQRLFGSIFHKAMQLIYNPDTNNSSLVSSGMIDAWLKEENHEHIRQVLGLAFNEVYFKNSENKSELYGKHRIDFEILIKLIIKILESDRNYAPFEVWHEKTEFFDLEVDNAVLQNVRIKAFIDRIDKKNDVYRVLDYKTGVQNNIFLDVEELFSNDRKLKSDAVFQILLYTIMYAENHNEAMHVIPGLIYLRDIYKSDDFMLKLKSKYGESFMSISPEIQESFIANLKNLIQEILNPDIPFVQTQNSDNCQYCNFRTMCVE
jgi:CRISPR/Cas system-associated exonuclease Cas4 (RecB family)